MKAARHSSILGLTALLVALSAVAATAGSFTFAGKANGLDVITHPTGYDGSGGLLQVSVCIDPTSLHASEMEIPVQNIVATLNALSAKTPNLFFDGDNNVPPDEFDWESVGLHEVAHCIGLGHVNVATESGLGGSDQDYTKSTTGDDSMWDLDAGADTLIGSADDLRGDDDNLHWFVTADNDPCTVVSAVSDSTTMARELADLPASHDYAANADRTVCADLGLVDTEAVMQQGTFLDEAQRDVTGDSVRTLRLGMSGLDELAGTADDYELELTYAGLADDCDVVIDFDDTLTGFAVCGSNAQLLDDTHLAIITANVYFNDTWAWFFNDVPIGIPSADPGGPYEAECDGTTASINLDGSGSSDPTAQPLSYAWTTDCPGGSFDDPSSPTPTITLDTSPGCDVICMVSLTVEDPDLNEDSRSADVHVSDSTAPAIACPAPVDLNTGPGDTDCLVPHIVASATCTDTCDPDPVCRHDAPALFPLGETGVRHEAEDDCGQVTFCMQRVMVTDDTPPQIDSITGVTAGECYFVEPTVSVRGSDNCSIASEVAVHSDRPDSDPTCDARDVEGMVTDGSSNSTTGCAGGSCPIPYSLNPDDCDGDSVPDCLQCDAVYDLACYQPTTSKLQFGSGAGDGKVTLKGVIDLSACPAGTDPFAELADSDRVRVLLDGWVAFDATLGSFDKTSGKPIYKRRLPSGTMQLNFVRNNWKLVDRASNLESGDVDNSDGVRHTIEIGAHGGERSLNMEVTRSGLQFRGSGSCP